MGGHEQQNKSADLAPDWALWLDLLAVNVSQCAALSLNLDPLKADQAPGQALQQELQRRRLVIGNHADNGGFRVTGRDFDRRTRKREPRLPLADFVLWTLGRSWSIPDPLARRFSASPAPALPEVPAMLSPDLLSIDEWAHRLACAECPIPSKPEAEAKRTIGAVIAWRADGPTPGLFRLRPKPGAVWQTLQDASDWLAEPITDPGEVTSYSGYVSQATKGHPPYPEPPVILAGGLQVFLVKTQLDPQWDDYNNASSAYGITRLWWEDQLVKAVNVEVLKACDAAKAVIKRQTVVPTRAYIKSDHLAAWMSEHQPFKDVSSAFTDSTNEGQPQTPGLPAIATYDAAGSTTAPAVTSDRDNPESKAATVAGVSINSKGMSAWKTLLLERRDEVLKEQDVGGVASVVRWIVREGEHIGIKRSIEPGSEISYRDGNKTVKHVGRDAISNALSALRKGQLGPKRHSEAESIFTA